MMAVRPPLTCVGTCACACACSPCRDDGSEAPPNVHVAAKSSRDAHNRLPAQAMTKMAKGSCNPVWGQTLEVGEGGGGAQRSQG